MSQTVGTNVLVYATHTGSPSHARARTLVERLIAGPDLAYLFWPTVLGYLRIVTHPAILESPLAGDEAMSNVEALLAPPHIRTAGEGDAFWEGFRTIAADLKPRGNLVRDAHLGALMREHGVPTIWSHDRDFRKFLGIRSETRSPTSVRQGSSSCTLPVTRPAPGRPRC